ncbi:MAG: META domain-containing protein [Defluviicoccus sp.]|nr:META domain-containing protein [Defluviicoccus sp.]
MWISRLGLVLAAGLAACQATPEKTVSAPPLITGAFMTLADAPRLTDCRTERSYPVAIAADYRRLEEAYLSAREKPGQPLLITFEGRITERPRAEEGTGTEPTAIIERFVHVWPGETCERNRVDASLTNTYWRLVLLGQEEIGAVAGRREPHLILRIGEPRFTATAGCNQLIGGYETDGESLRFGAAAATRMACPPPLDERERRLVDVLANTRTWRISGPALELRDGEQRPLALLQAVYLR